MPRDELCPIHLIEHREKEGSSFHKDCSSDEELSVKIDLSDFEERIDEPNEFID